MTDQNIVDPSDLRKWRIELPNLYDDIGLSPFEFRLLAHYKRVGNCTEGLTYTAKKCGMSMGQASKTRTSLHKRGLIKLKRYSTPRGPGFVVGVVDVWPLNFAAYSGGAEEVAAAAAKFKASPHEAYASPHEAYASPGETKNKPIKKELTKKGDLNTTTAAKELKATGEPVAPIAVAAVVSWGDVDLVGLAKLPKKYTIKDPKHFVAMYLYAITQPTLKHPALWAAKSEDKKPGEPFQTLAAVGPAALALVVSWLYHGQGFEKLNGLSAHALAFKGWCKSPEAIAARAANELGLTLTEPVSIITEDDSPRPMPTDARDDWQKFLDTQSLPRPLMERLRYSKFLRREGETYIIGIHAHEVSWFENRKVSASFRPFADVKFQEMP